MMKMLKWSEFFDEMIQPIYTYINIGLKQIRDQAFYQHIYPWIDKKLNSALPLRIFFFIY